MLALNRLHTILRADSRLVPSQWETALQSNAVSHWLGANLASALILHVISHSYLAHTGPHRANLSTFCTNLERGNLLSSLYFVLPDYTPFEDQWPFFKRYCLDAFTPLQWRHIERGDVSNHQCLDCLLNRLFTYRSKKTSKLRVTGLCEANPPVTGGFPSQRASSAGDVSIWWRHYAF